MFFVLNRAVEKLLNFWMERGQPTFLLRVGKVYALISTRGDNVEFGIKDINTMNNSVEAGKGESRVALILANGVLAEKVEG